MSRYPYVPPRGWPVCAAVGVLALLAWIIAGVV
jgi:hypothetical protein